MPGSVRLMGRQSRRFIVHAGRCSPKAYVRPILATRRALVYGLPEARPLREVFGSYDVAVTRRP